jgi:hypothetical protein
MFLIKEYDLLIKRDGGTGPMKSRQQAQDECCAKSSKRKCLKDEKGVLL